MNISLPDSELNKLYNYLEKGNKVVEKRAREFVTVAAYEFDKRVKTETPPTPVRTGRLRASIHVENKPNENFRYSVRFAVKNGNKSKVANMLSFNGGLGLPLKKLESVVGTNVEYAEKVDTRTSYFNSKTANFENDFIQKAAELLNNLDNEL